GNEILPRARALLEMADDMRHAVAAPESAPRGLLRITASAAFSHAQLAAAVADYARRHPAVSVDLVLAEHAVNLVDERIDLAIRIASELDPNLIARRLTVCRSVVCASPAYLAAHAAPRRVEDLAGHNCLTHGQHGKSLWHFERGGETLSVAVGGSLSANDAASLAQAALGGTGIVMLPTYLAASMIQDGQLVALLPETPPRVLQIHAVYASRKHISAALRTMLDFLAERFGAEPAWDRPPQRP
ncbi:MAG: substrate binding domain-containing protein, partial [Variovorax sp.]